jgi:hypothetical protein
MKTIVAENKRTNETVEFTFEQWMNLEKSGHSKYWRITDTSALVPDEVIPVVFSKEKEIKDEETDWRQKLIDENIPFNKSIKNPDKLKEIYENYKFS